MVLSPDVLPGEGTGTVNGTFQLFHDLTTHLERCEPFAGAALRQCSAPLVEAEWGIIPRDLKISFVPACVM